jgi:XTP/dITP diphosphohydrolase
MQVILSTRNPSKVEQVKAVFAGSAIEVVTLDEAGISGEVIEDGDELEDNAMKKAVFAHLKSPDSWVMADDTGFYIYALNGRPGIHAARWAGENATTEEITRHTLQQLSGADNRRGAFVTMVAVISPTGDRFFFSGSVDGQILEAPRVPAQPKMPYSPIFVPDGQDKVWAEMDVEFENSISHRGIAFRKAKEFFERFIEPVP